MKTILYDDRDEIYILEKNGAHKIGISSNLKRRMIEIVRGANSLNIVYRKKVDDAVGIETLLSMKFRKKNVGLVEKPSGKTEWYVLNDEDVRFAAQFIELYQRDKAAAVDELAKSL